MYKLNADQMVTVCDLDLTGRPQAPTAVVDTATNQIATTAFVVNQGYAKLASPAFTGTVSLANADLSIGDGHDIALGTSTGTRIGTRIGEMLAFYGSTPITKPSGNVTTALTSLGLVTAPTIPQSSACFDTPFLHPLEAATSTIQAAGTTYFQYLGRVNQSKGACTVLYTLRTTMETNILWGEMSIWKGTPRVGLPAASLTRCGVTDCDVSGQFLGAPGVQSVIIPLINIDAGDDLWLGSGSDATTPAQFDSLLIDRFGSGMTLSVVGRSSTITSPCTTAILNTTVSAPAVLVFI